MTVLEPEEYVAHYKSGFQALFALMKPALEGVHAAAVLNVQAARAACAECACALQAAFQYYTPADLPARQLGAAQQAAEMAASYSRQLFEIATRTQVEWTRVAQAQYGQINRNVQELSGGVGRSAPAGSGAAIALAKARLSKVHAAAETPRTITTQSPVTAQDDFDAASAAVAQAATRAAGARQV